MTESLVVGSRHRLSTNWSGYSQLARAVRIGQSILYISVAFWAESQGENVCSRHPPLAPLLGFCLAASVAFPVGFPIFFGAQGKLLCRPSVWVLLASPVGSPIFTGARGCVFCFRMLARGLPFLQECTWSFFCCLFKYCLGDS